MALGFFRKWQKAIIVIMVVLMMSFLLGGTGMRLLCDQRSGDAPRGASKHGQVMWSQAMSADKDIKDLALFLRLDLRSIEFAQLRRNGENETMAYTLLLQEAQTAGHKVGEAEVDDYLKGIGLEVDKAEYRKLLGRLNRRNAGTTEPRLRASLARWLMVLRSFQAYKVASPPSDLRIRKLFRDLNEKMDFRVLKVPADKYTAGVKDPTKEQIDAFFKKYSSAKPGVYPKDDSFGFGYAQPVRVSVAYLLVNNDVIARVTRPRDRDVREYFRQNSKEFTKDVPVTTQPGATTQPNAETRKVQMDIDEAWDQVVERLSMQAAESRIEEFIQLVQANIENELGPAPANAELYKKVFARMIDNSRAAKALDKVIQAKDIAALRGKTLDKAMPQLAIAAGLEAICYPWGVGGEFSVSKEVRIPASLQAGGPRKLGDVLSDITRLVFTAAKDELEAIPAAGDKAKDAATTKPEKKAPATKPSQYPKLKWTTCQGFAKALFPVSDDKGSTLLPIRSGQTELVDIEKLSANEDIGGARSSRRGRGQSLPEIAVKSKPLVPGQVMYAINENGGLRRILWQVLKSQPAEVLEQPTEAVRKQVIEDYKLLQAFKAGALTQADIIVSNARTKGLEVAAKDAKLETVVTGPTSRLTAFSQQAMARQTIMQQAFMGGLPPGRTVQEFMAQVQAYAERVAMMYQPFEYRSSRIQGVQLPTAGANKRFLDLSFAKLVPADINKTIGPRGPVVSIPMPNARAYYVVQRVGYTPAVAGDFEQTERSKLAGEILANTAWAARRVFFDHDGIVKRVDYKDRRQVTESDEE